MSALTTIKVRRGLKADLPASAAEGELLLAIDTFELFKGTGTGVDPINVDKENVIGLLDGGGKIDASLLPALALTEVYVVADIAGRDGLTVQEGDVAVVQDASGDPQVNAAVRISYIYDGSAWHRLNTQDAVTSVNGATGDVVLTTDDIAEGSTNLYYTDARVNAVIDTRRGAANGIASLNANAKMVEGEMGTGTPTDGHILAATGGGEAEWTDIIDGGTFL